MADSSEAPAVTALTIEAPEAAASPKAETSGQHVEVDDDAHGDADSAFGESILSSTTSLSSSIRNHTYENGRRYHAYQSGSYFAPNDDAENDRLDMHHHLATLLIGGKVTTAPIGKNPQRILDVGCGTGIWSIDAGDEYPSAQVLGVDLSPTQPSMVPPNVQFEVDDVEEDWTFQTRFDLVHARFLTGSILDWPKLVNQCFARTKPGGWAEFKDWDMTLISSDDSVPHDSYTYKYHQLLYEALDIIKRSYKPGPSLKKWAEEAGYENVTEEILPVPMGLWPKDKKLREIGAWNFICLEEGLEAVCIRLFTSVHGWSNEEVQVFLAKVRAEIKAMKRNRWHFQYTYFIVTGQRPEDAKAAA